MLHSSKLKIIIAIVAITCIASSHSELFSASFLKKAESSPESITIIPTLTKTDIIYSRSHNTIPVVNEEFKVIFFQVGKCASTEWLRFFIRLNDDPTWCSDEPIHERKVNGLKYLSDYTIDEAQRMMLDPEWTKAIFVRNPKPRLLSAFLDKARNKAHHFKETTCVRYHRLKQRQGDNDPNIDTYQSCMENSNKFDFFLREITTTLNENVHWRSISSRIDAKWWPYVNFVGNMENLTEDAQSFLMNIYSNVDGVSAWDRIGTSGWSENERDCKTTLNSPGQFLGKRDARHTTSAREQMLTYYTPELEKFVETHYADDLQNQYFHFSPVNLYTDDSGHPVERVDRILP